MPVFIALVTAAVVGVLAYLVGVRRTEQRLARRFVSSVESGVAAGSPASLSASGPDSPSVSTGSAPIGGRRSDLYVAQALSGLRLGVVIVDVDGREIFRNTVARSFADARHGNALVEAALRRVVDGARVGLSLEETVDLFGPPQRNFVVQASPLPGRDAGPGGSGEPVGVVAVIDDVTEARRVERVRSDFVANVSHEIRTPVGAMSVLAETLLDSDDDDVRQRMAERIQTECLRLTETIEDLLVLARFEAGHNEEPAPLDLQSVVSSAVERAAGLVAQREATVAVANRVDGPVMVDGDQAQLTSAVVNLLANAVKYSDVGARIEVTLDIEPSIDADRSGPAVLSVADPGIGIPALDIPRIFERFYRVDTARSRSTGGTGLGLSIVRNVVANHGGHVEVTSTEGVGSVFTVRLPLSPVHLQTRPLFDESDDAPPGDGGRTSDSGRRS